MAHVATFVCGLAKIAAGADMLSIAESHHSLEDAHLELIDADVEARRR
ncbi:MAG: hypothetical protein ACLP50_13215 [Solirubrobacteraceae bacterium]